MPRKSENKNTIMALWHPFKPKQVGNGRESEKIKIIVTLLSYPTRNRKYQRNSKKIKKVKKIPLWLHFKPKIGWKRRGKR